MFSSHTRWHGLSLLPPLRRRLKPNVCRSRSASPRRGIKPGPPLHSRAAETPTHGRTMRTSSAKQSSTAAPLVFSPTLTGQRATLYSQGRLQQFPVWFSVWSHDQLVCSRVADARRPSAVLGLCIAHACISSSSLHSHHVGYFPPSLCAKFFT